MLIYWLMYLLVASLTIVVGPSRNRPNIGIWVTIGFIFTFLIGFRHEVGGDWFNYLQHFENISHYTVGEILRDEDPGYYLINLWMYEWGWGIYGVNLVSGLIFIIGLIRLVRQQYNPWLALSVAVPYLVIVVAMGYTRQAVAIGFVMWAIAVLDEKKFVRFLIFIALAATFHKSAVVMVGVGMFGQGTGRMMRIVAVGFVGMGIYSAFLAEHQEKLVEIYVDTQMQSQGALIRVIMNLVPALFFFWMRKEWKYYYDDYAFWRIITVGAIGALFVVGVASTAVDRMALYMIPLQIVVFGRLPLLIGQKVSPKSAAIMVLGYYALVLFVWLNFAVNSISWLPYQNFIWSGIF